MTPAMQVWVREPRASRGPSGGTHGHLKDIGYSCNRTGNGYGFRATLSSVAARQGNHHKAMDRADRSPPATRLRYSYRLKRAKFARSGGYARRSQDQRHLPGLLIELLLFTGSGTPDVSVVPLEDRERQIFTGLERFTRSWRRRATISVRA